MTPKEKALELVNKHAIYCNGGGMFAILQSAKQCSIILVDEILNMNLCLPVVLTIQDEKDIENSIKILSEYWKEVKQEIEKL